MPTPDQLWFQLWFYLSSALQTLVTFRALAVITLGAGAYWLIPVRYRRHALIPISLIALLVGYQRPVLLVIGVALTCSLVYAAVCRGAPKTWIVIAIIAFYIVLHLLYGFLTFTTWLNWTGLTSEYALPTIGLTVAFTFLRLIHFTVDYGAGEQRSMGARETAHPRSSARPRSSAPPLPLTFAAWCLFFPTFVHLPMIRYPEFAKQFLCPPDRLTAHHVQVTITRVVTALFKGVIVALIYITLNPTGILLNPSNASFPQLFFAAIISGASYYIGFSGFTDLSVGVGSLYGYTLPESFAPARKMVRINRMRDFWRNWNITTTQWLNDYVYQPLGGARCHPVRNVLLTMTICGLWHSISVFGFLWGFGLGMLLLIEHGWNRLRIRRRWPEIPAPVRSVLLLCALAFVNLFLTPYGYAAQTARAFYPLWWLGLTS
jgi:D-alanyl-lipoteichoic acid acyltransferase DltB (MBOAT superfamily)